MEKRVVSTPHAPKAVGPYSQGIVAGGLLFTSMQLPLDPATGKLVEGPIDLQARRVLDNIRAVAEAGGGSLDGVVKATLYLADFADFAAVNAVFAVYFPNDPPARSALAATLPLGARVALDAVVALP